MGKEFTIWTYAPIHFGMRAQLFEVDPDHKSDRTSYKFQTQDEDKYKDVLSFAFIDEVRPIEGSLVMHQGFIRGNHAKFLEIQINVFPEPPPPVCEPEEYEEEYEEDKPYCKVVWFDGTPDNACSLVNLQFEQGYELKGIVLGTSLLFTRRQV